MTIEEKLEKTENDAVIPEKNEGDSALENVEGDASSEERRFDDGDKEAVVFSDDDQTGESSDELETSAAEAFDDVSELEEINRICNGVYSSLEDIPNYQRYRQLRERGAITVEEALYAVNHGKLPRKSRKELNAPSGKRSFDARSHLSASHNKGSFGEVLTKADREEMALWGISATGTELERLWRASK